MHCARCLFSGFLLVLSDNPVELGQVDRAMMKMRLGREIQ